MSKQQDTTGIDAARATALRIRNEVESEKAQRALAAKKAIDAAKLSPEAIAYMNRHQDTGVEDLNTGVSVPQLRIHSVNISTKNQLLNGGEPTDGQIFHTGLQQAWDQVTVVLLSIKKCRLSQTDEESGATSMKANYLLAGVIDDTLEPFIMYVKGMSYNKIWDLEEQLKPYVTKRAGGIPLSMLKVIVSSAKEKVEQGKYKGQLKNVFNFKLLMHESGEFPILENDQDRLNVLEKATDNSESMLDRLIASKGMTEKEWNQQRTENNNLADDVKNNVIEGETVPAKSEENLETPPDNFETTDAEDVSDDIPF